METPPNTVDSIIFQLPMPVNMRIKAPIRIARADVSPIEPGIKPKNASENDGKASKLPNAALANGVAPENPSTTPSPVDRPEIQTTSPDIFVGYAKNRKALAIKAGFQTFMPVPPNTSLQIITENIVANEIIHKGTSTGEIRGISIPVTRNPSLTSCLRICAKANSTARPET
ncbi:MAG: hypothetical protein DDT42_02040 [candidate division WS2 bacterium]|uniref:Uncharacterized protein n=1 Tax=Psychracetigena formicireducens TaxID=2986056 RepID=A0A9E2F808_PSYF1|nr:hypothetical protein [Candidatus Psychracetigena formicireducens]